MSLAYYLFAPDTPDAQDRKEPFESSESHGRETREQDPVEHALVARVRAGDVGAFREIYLAHYAELVRLALSMGCPRDEAEDAAQQVFAELWDRRAAWHPYRIGPALVRALRHRVLDDVRRLQRLAPADEGEQGGVLPGADVALEYDELEMALAAAVAQLPERRRTALLLRALRQMSYAEIGEVMDVSEKGAFLLVSRARTALEPIRDRFLETGRLKEQKNKV